MSRIKNVSDTDDIIQTIYISLWKRMCSKGELDTQQALKILYVSAKHEIGHYYLRLKIQKIHTYLSMDDSSSQELLQRRLDESTFLSYVQTSMDEVLLHSIWTYIKERGELVYRIFILHYIVGFTFDECASLLQMNSSKLTYIVYHTIAEIKKSFLKDEDFV